MQQMYQNRFLKQQGYLVLERSQMQQTYQQPVQPAPQQTANTQQKEFSQVADKLSTMFAEAYQLISQFKSGLDAQPEPQQQPQRTAQPAMQILRPEAVNAENFYPRR